jgi:DNA-binding NarL/FixJ family response regulator
MQTTVALIDDHKLFREGLRGLLETKSDIQVVGEAGNSAEALEMVQRTNPDVVVLDLLLPGGSGVTVSRELMRQDPKRKVLALSMLKEEQYVAQALDAGALGYASKEQSVEDVVAAIRQVARRQPYLPPGLSKSVLEDLRLGLRRESEGSLASLTNRERQIFSLTVSGMTTADIAQQLFISKRTVETHRARILRKLHARSATDLVRLAARLGVLPP